VAHLRSLYNELSIKLFYRNRKNGFFSPAKWGVNLSKIDLVSQADIINLHAVVNGFISLNGIKKLGNLNKPLVWTLHDQWAFTGGCHYSRECRKFKESCGKCPLLSSTRENDITRKIWEKKKKIYEDLDLTVVTPSIWMANRARESSLLKNTEINIIPNPLNTGVFKPVSSEIAREALNLPKNKILILFGSTQGTRPERKGFSYLLKAFKLLKERERKYNGEIELVVFGSSNQKEISHLPVKTTFLGYLNDNYSLALSYNAADLFVGPSLQESFGQTFSESMACGTPCIAFDYSGPRDIIDHKENGYLAKYKSPESLAKGIIWLLKDREKLKELGAKARKKAKNEYNMLTVGEQYRNLHGELLS